MRVKFSETASRWNKPMGDETSKRSFPLRRCSADVREVIGRIFARPLHSFLPYLLEIEHCWFIFSPHFIAPAYNYNANIDEL